jgi:hypothetical protein
MLFPRGKSVFLPMMLQIAPLGSVLCPNALMLDLRLRGAVGEDGLKYIFLM